MSTKHQNIGSVRVRKVRDTPHLFSTILATKPWLLPLLRKEPACGRLDMTLSATNTSVNRGLREILQTQGKKYK